MTRREEAIEKAAAAILEATSRTRGGALIARSTAAIDIAAGTISAYEAHMRPEVKDPREANDFPVGTVVLAGTWVWEKDADGWITTGAGGSEPLPIDRSTINRVIHWGAE